MSVTLLYFAALREALGTSSEKLELPPDIGTVAQLRQHLAERGGNWQTLTTMKNLKAAVNQSMAPLETSVKDGDEIAFFPPVTGG